MVSSRLCKNEGIGEAFEFWLSVAVVLVALFTDIADGYLARKWGVASEAGYFLDGIGDKCFTVAFCLVISRTMPSLDILSFTLIVREIILYALRAIDPDKVNNIATLRPITLWQAGSIRIYFFLFFVISGAKVYGHDISEVVVWIFILFGITSSLFGLASVFFLSRTLIKQTTCTQ